MCGGFRLTRVSQGVRTTFGKKNLVFGKNGASPRLTGIFGGVDLEEDSILHLVVWVLPGANDSSRVLGH